MVSKNSVKLVLFLLVCPGCMNPASNKENWETLFNGKDLSGWETYLGPRFDTIRNDWDTIPIGLNEDPSNVFGMVELDGEKVLRISGEHFGGISTIREFENYHLQLQFKWGQLKWPPRENDVRDGGLMYHAVGPHGADGGFWMRSQEFQIEEGDCGDYWACAGAIFDIKANMDQDSTYVYNPDGELLTFSTVSPLGRYCKKNPDAEKPTGEWNTLDLYCIGSTSVHMVNGVVNMILQNSRQLEGDGEIPLTKGKIQFESEGAELFLRNVQISFIDKLPEELLK
jgi:hypothetical protein